MMRRGLRGLLAALTVLGFLLIGGSASAATLLVFAGNGSGGFSGDGGPASSARLLQPRGIAADSFGNLYIADYGNKRVREVTTDGVIHTVGGTGVSAWNQENGTATSTNMQPMDVAVTDSGVIYVADYSNWRLREIDPYGNETLVAGPSATAGHSFNNIRSVAYDNLTGTIYVANSPYLYAVRQVGGSTSISIVAGNGSNCGTTPAPDGSTPTSVAVCPTYVAVANGIIYMAETDVNAVQKIDANGLLQTVAGTGAPGYTGDGGQGVHAKLWMPSGVAVDKQGDVYIADNANDAIREVDPSGVISTVATTSGADPQGVSVSPDGGVYVSTYNGSTFASRVLITNSNQSSNQPLHPDNYIAVGDSVAAGEGIDYGWHWSGSSWAPNTSGPNTPWLDPTRGLGGNYQSCHESPWAYPQLVSQDNAFNMTESACTGAGSLSGLLNSESVTNPDTSTTDNVPPQVGGSCTDCGLPNYLASQNSDPNSPTLYTLTVGADDIDFANWISQCYAGVTACNTDANSSTLNEQISQAKSHLEEVLDVVDSQNSSALYTPLVLVTGYYDPIPSPTSNASCTDTSTSTWVGITTDENNWLQDGLSNLNIAISQAVTYAQTAEAHIQVEFVDLSTAFAGHEFCSTDPWAYGPSIQYNLGTAYANNPAPFHPTPEGQRAIATAVEAAITSARTGGWVG